MHTTHFYKGYIIFYEKKPKDSLMSINPSMIKHASSAMVQYMNVFAYRCFHIIVCRFLKYKII